MWWACARALGNVCLCMFALSVYVGVPRPPRQVSVPVSLPKGCVAVFMRLLSYSSAHARAVFLQLEPTAATHNALLNACQRGGCLHQALAVFDSIQGSHSCAGHGVRAGDEGGQGGGGQEMLGRRRSDASGVSAGVVALACYNDLISACAKAGDVVLALQVEWEYGMHVFVLTERGCACVCARERETVSACVRVTSQTWCRQYETPLLLPVDTPLFPYRCMHSCSAPVTSQTW